MKELKIKIMERYKGFKKEQEMPCMLIESRKLSCIPSQK
jgi:hypothetical protein